MSIEQNDLEVARYLLNYYGKHAWLMRIIVESHNTLLQEVNHKAKGMTLVHMAALLANIETTRLLVEYHVDFTKLSGNRDTHLSIVIPITYNQGHNAKTISLCFTAS